MTSFIETHKTVVPQWEKQNFSNPFIYIEVETQFEQCLFYYSGHRQILQLPAVEVVFTIARRQKASEHCDTVSILYVEI